MRYSLLLVIVFFTIKSWSQTPAFQQKLAQLERDVPLLATGDIEFMVNQVTSFHSSDIEQTLSLFYAKDEQLKALFIENGLPAELRFACLLDERGLPKETPFFEVDTAMARSAAVTMTEYIDGRRGLMISSSLFIESLKSIDKTTQNWLKRYLLATNSEESDTQCSALKTNKEYINCLPISLRSKYTNLVASIYVGSNADLRGLRTQIDSSEYVQVVAEEYTTLYQLARQLEMEFQDLKRVNPIYYKNIIPGNNAECYVTIPKAKLNDWRRLGKNIYSYGKPIKTYASTEVKFIINSVVQDDTSDREILEILDAQDAMEDSLMTTVMYSIRSGDIMLKIADLFDCEVVQIKRWNQLENEDDIDIDQQIIIKVPKARAAYYQRIDTLTNEQRKIIINRD